MVFTYESKAVDLLDEGVHHFSVSVVIIDGLDVQFVEYQQYLPVVEYCDVVILSHEDNLVAHRHVVVL